MSAVFENVLAVVALVREFPGPWFVSGSWAIDLFLGEVTRSHDDVEIGIFRHDQRLLQPLLTGQVVQRCKNVGDEIELVPWEEGETIERPDFQIKVNFETGGRPAFDVFLNTVEDGEMMFRRNHAIRRPWRENVLWTSDGIPYLAPEWQLLYKAKRNEEKDRHDLQLAVERMDAGQRGWLKGAVEVAHPGHEWIEEL